MFLGCPAYLDEDGARRCGLPAEVRCRFTMRSSDGPVDAATIRCPAGHWFNGPIESLTWDGKNNHDPGTAAAGSRTGRDRLQRGQMPSRWRRIRPARFPRRAKAEPPPPERCPGLRSGAACPPADHRHEPTLQAQTGGRRPQPSRRRPTTELRPRAVPLSGQAASVRVKTATVGSRVKSPSALKDVVDMQRYLLVLDTGLRARDEELAQEPASYLAAQQHQQGPCEVVVLSVADTSQTKLSSLELLLGAATAQGQYAPAKYPTAPQPGHDVNAAAEHRMTVTVRHLRSVGCQASGLISDEDMVTAVDAETRRNNYDEVLLVTSGQDGSRLTRTLHLDPIHHLQRRWGEKLTVFTADGGTQPDR
jgi:hypothetical protein